MYNKTATAVVLALLGAAKAADIADVTPENYKEKAMLKSYGCTARTIAYDLLSGADANIQDAADVAAAIAGDGSEDHDPVFACFGAALGLTTDADNHCVSYVPASTDINGHEVAATCRMHVGFGLECDESAATTVYMKAGAPQDDAEVREEHCSRTLDDAHIERYCRCAGWSWTPVTEEVGQVEDGEPVLDSEGNQVMETQYVVLTDADDEVIKTVNGEDALEMEWTCPVYKEENGDVKEDQTPPYYDTNWVQLPVVDGEVSHFTTCPAAWEVPADSPPADRGSFKGWSNRYTFSAVADDFHEEGNTVTWNNESEGYTEWSDAAFIGAVFGFGVFGLGIILVVAMIAVDMSRRMAMYEELIAEDLQKMEQMGLSPRSAQMEAELAARLAGGVGEAGVDDQLVTQALELRHEDFAKHM